MNRLIAVRALNVAFGRNATLQAQFEGARCDREFDAGEWSDAHHARIIEAIEKDIAARVAFRFAMEPAFLLRQYRRWEEDTVQRMIAVLIKEQA